jgi:hypothetical protein
MINIINNILYQHNITNALKQEKKFYQQHSIFFLCKFKNNIGI